MPQTGRNHSDILADMQSFGKRDADYSEGRTFSLVYYLGDEYTQFLKDAYNLYFSENGLNPLAFKSLKRFETEVVRMSIDMLNGDAQAVGTITSGGTESCLLAVKTYRDLAKSKKPWILSPEMIVPTTIHPAFEKAAEYFGVKAVHAPLGPDYRVDVKAVKRRINRNTILIVGSAPCYPFGVVDPIEELAKLAKRKNIPMHVDACVGGFLLPFVERLGYDVPPFDFRNEGVTSISADIHKYGFAAKGASVILYRNMDYLKHQMFIFTEWPGGIFASPALLGTRPGGSIGAAWAAMQAHGFEGYTNNARTAMDTANKLMAGINAISGLQVVGKPHACIFAYTSTDPTLNLYAVADRMEERGWHIDRQQKPEALHAMITPRHALIADKYLADLRESVDIVRKNPDLAVSGNAAMYGMIANIPLRGMIKQNVLKIFMQLYGPDGDQVQLDQGDDDLGTRAGMWFLKMRDKIKRSRSGH
jgi:glutamate/tyrosine decarboxylase-like PLP-dependent enzyme